jgi:hypothetical protein
LNRFEIAEDLRNKPKDQLIKFKAIRDYYSDGYKLSHSGIWHLTFKHMSIMSEKDADFWQVISMYDFKPFEITDTIGDDSKPSDYDPPDKNTNFMPSHGRDFGSDEKYIRPFPIWEWNEYVPEYMERYKVG